MYGARTEATSTMLNAITVGLAHGVVFASKLFLQMQCAALVGTGEVCKMADFYMKSATSNQYLLIKMVNNNSARPYNHVCMSVCVCIYIYIYIYEIILL